MNSMMKTAVGLKDAGILGRDIFDSIMRLMKVRNMIVHSLEFEIEDYDIDYYIQISKSIIEKL